MTALVLNGIIGSGVFVLPGTVGGSLGWASLAIMGVVYRVYPAASETRLARAHFWIHNIALPVFMVGLGFALTGHEAAMPVAIAGALTVAIGILVFAVNIFMTIRPAAATATFAQAVRANA